MQTLYLFIVQLIVRPGASGTFNEYSGPILYLYIRNQLDSVQRVDVVWDTYIDNSLTYASRRKQGRGIRRRVQGQTSYQETRIAS